MNFCVEENAFDFFLLKADDESNLKLLNCLRIFSGFVRSPWDIITDLQKLILQIYREFMLCTSFEDRLKPIDYVALEKSFIWRKFVTQSVELQMVFFKKNELASFKDAFGFNFLGAFFFRFNLMY